MRKRYNADLNLTKDNRDSLVQNAIYNMVPYNEVEVIALKLMDKKTNKGSIGGRPKELKPVTIRKFSWE